MDIEDIKRRVLSQRMHRFPDTGPDLAGAGAARYRQETGRLRVAFAGIRAGRETTAIERVQRFARQRGIEVHWVVVPERPGEGSLSDALHAAQFRLDENLLLMAHEGFVSAPRNPTVIVSTIESQQAMWQYEYGSRQAFFDEQYPAEAAVSQRARERWREHEHGWCRYYAAALQGHTVGGCYVSLFEEIPTILGNIVTADSLEVVTATPRSHRDGDSDGARASRARTRARRGEGLREEALTHSSREKAPRQTPRGFRLACLVLLWAIIRL